MTRSIRVQWRLPNDIHIVHKHLPTLSLIHGGRWSPPQVKPTKITRTRDCYWIETLESDFHIDLSNTDTYFTKELKVLVKIWGKLKTYRARSSEGKERLKYLKNEFVEALALRAGENQCSPSERHQLFFLATYKVTPTHFYSIYTNENDTLLFVIPEGYDPASYSLGKIKSIKNHCVPNHQKEYTHI
ncbi:MAG: hypothetical protein WC059_00495 [Candidatus Paceibacterota bacterium]